MRTPRQQKRSFRKLGWMMAWNISTLLLLLSISSTASSSHSSSSSEELSLSFPFPKATWETCSSHASCDECYSASHTCHWCAFDNACHAKGNTYSGCASGASCSTTPKQDSPTCADHKSCGDCTNSSWECHWCSSDEMCHAVGSMHGCAAGTDCYAINRCQRLEPERMDYGGTFSKASFRGVGPVAKGVLWIMMGLILCCSTMCFGGASFIKSAVDDLVGEPVEIVEDGMLISGGGGGGSHGYERVQSVEGTDDEGGGGHHADELEIPLMQNETVEEGNDTTGYGDDTDNKPKSDPAALMRRSEPASVARSRTSTRAAPRGGSNIKQMFCFCQLCYLFTILTTILMFTLGMSYAPREPQYNVCTNEIAWKSIVEGMTSLKMSASFDLLISVYNPNRFEVDLSNGHGQFHHDGEYVGSFDIPEGKISERAISDIVVKVTFTPDKWSALSLTSEYYQKKLKFVIGGHAHVKIPALGNYSFDAKFDDIHVNVNDPSLDDTHLCACPGWTKP